MARTAGATSAKEPKAPKAPKEAKVIKIPPLKLKEILITIVGTTGLLVNRFDEKSRQQIEDDYRGVAKNKKQPISAEEEYQRSLYRIPGKKDAYGIPAAGLKHTAVNACRFVEGVPMTIATGAFHVVDDISGLVPVKGKPRMDERIVRVGNFGNKKPATRRRAIFDDWECTFRVRYNEGVINAEQLLNLYENAGFSVGLCEYRPEKKGNLGMFEVKRH